VSKPALSKQQRRNYYHRCDLDRSTQLRKESKGKQWHFGIKVHNRCAEASGYGVDKDTGFIHSVKTTAANVHDLTPCSRPAAR
jgi:IS5 family transposase